MDPESLGQVHLAIVDAAAQEVVENHLSQGIRLRRTVAMYGYDGLMTLMMTMTMTMMPRMTMTTMTTMTMMLMMM